MKPKKKKQKYLNILFYLILILIFILSFMVRLWPLQTAHWWDEAVYLQNAEVIYSGANNYHELNFRPPLLSIIFALAFFVKHHVFTGSIVVAILGMLAPIFTYLIGKKLYDKKTGFIAGIIMAFSPFIVENSRYIMTDIPSLSLICIGFYFLVLGDKHKKNYHYLLSGLFFAFAVLMRFTSLILLFIIPLYLLIKKINFRKILPFGIGFAIGIVPYFIWAQITQGNFLKPFIIAQAVVSDRNEALFFYIINFLKAYPIAVLIGLILWLVSTLLFFNFKTLIRKKELIITTRIKLEKHLNKVDLVFLIWLLLFFIYMTFMVPHKELRYIIPIALPLIMLSSRGIAYFINHRSKIIRYATLFFIVVIFLGSFAPSFTKLSAPLINTYKTEEMEVSEFIVETYPPSTVIYSNHNYHVFAYYTKMRTLKLENQDESFYAVFPKNMKEKGLLLIYKGIKHPTPEWTNNNPTFKLAKEFTNIRIYEYEP
ncbi:glycosyltransferase family 39 protein [Candidatus Woesearchaeota archaeon]|nr:glycosyltransferase family 39 protein [Candidatus Woesearchaeota archaeon]